MNVTIFHNPRCSKSRETLALLRTNGIEARVVEYLVHVPTVSALKVILKKLNMRADQLIRTKQAEFQHAKIDLSNEDEVLEFMTRHPKVIERPIVITERAAAIGRPPEEVLKLFQM